MDIRIEFDSEDMDRIFCEAAERVLKAPKGMKWYVTERLSYRTKVELISIPEPVPMSSSTPPSINPTDPADPSDFDTTI